MIKAFFPSKDWGLFAQGELKMYSCQGVKIKWREGGTMAWQPALLVYLSMILSGAYIGYQTKGKAK